MRRDWLGLGSVMNDLDSHMIFSLFLIFCTFSAKVIAYQLHHI